MDSNQKEDEFGIVEPHEPGPAEGKKPASRFRIFFILVMAVFFVTAVVTVWFSYLKQKEQQAIAERVPVCVFPKDTNQAADSTYHSRGNDILLCVEEYPEFPGGQKALMNFINGNLHYPADAKKLGIQGKVFVTFVVEKEGTLTGLRVLRGIGGGCEEEAVRIVKKMPRWVPGKFKGERVRVQYNLPVKFTLP